MRLGRLERVLGRFDNDGASRTVDDDEIAVGKLVAYTRNRQYGRDLHGARQDGGMARQATGLGDDAGHSTRADACSHRWREVVCDDNALERQSAHVDRALVQQLGEHAGFHVAHIGGALHGQLVARRLEHGGEHLADLDKRVFCAHAALDELDHFALHVRVADHDDVTCQNLSFLFANGLAHGFRLPVGVVDVACDGSIEALGFSSGVLDRAADVIESRLFDDDHASNADAGASSCTFQIHMCLPCSVEVLRETVV